MKILWLNANLLLPLDKGGKLRTWHLMRHLASEHDITYVSFCEPDHDPADREGMRQVCARIEVIPRRDAPKGSLKFKTEVARHLLGRAPYAVGKYRSRAYRKTIQRLLQTGAFDLLVCDFLFPAVNLPRKLPCPAVIFTHNVESEIWRRHAQTNKGWLRRFLFGSQWRRMVRHEAGTLSRFDLILTVSDQDRETFRSIYDIAAPMHVVPTGVDTDYFHPLADIRPNPTHLVFTGSMDWLPNEDGILYFAKEVLPLIRREEPGATFSIVGRSPTAPIRRLAEDPGIEVTGRVADVRPHVARAGIYVVPLRIGGGTRLKIFEAMAMGRAVVSTTIGAEGLPVKDGHDIVLADDATTFARAVVRLMRDMRRRAALEQAALQTVRDYAWPVVTRQLNAALTAAAMSRKPVPPPAFTTLTDSANS